MLTYRPRHATKMVLLHASHTLPEQSNMEHFLAAQGRAMGLLEIGYHFLILQDGKLVSCRPHTVQGSHCRGKLNRVSIGVCLAGGLGMVLCEDCGGSGLRLSPLTGEPTECLTCDGIQRVEGPEDNFTPAQWETLRGLMAYLGEFYGPLPLRGHSEVHSRHHRACPPVNMNEVRENCLPKRN